MRIRELAEGLDFNGSYRVAGFGDEFDSLMANIATAADLARTEVLKRYPFSSMPAVG